MKVRLHLSIEPGAGHIEEIKEVIMLERPTKLTPVESTGVLDSRV